MNATTATMPDQLSCLHRDRPLGYGSLNRGKSPRPFALPSSLRVRGQGKRPLPDLSPACTMEIKAKNKKEKHHLTHQSHSVYQALARIAIKEDKKTRVEMFQILLTDLKRLQRSHH
jgi:hypothetical protein